MSPSKAQIEETLLTLPVGHPQAGYVGPDTSFTDGAGTLPSEEQDAREEARAAWEEETAAVAEHEHEVATAEREEELNPPEPEVASKQTRSTPTSEPKASS